MWKVARETPLNKAEDNLLVKNYRPISVLPVRKVLVCYFSISPRILLGKILLGKLEHIGLSARSLRCFKSYLRVYKSRSIWDLTLSTWVCRKGSLWTGLLSSGELGRAKSEKACRQTFWTAVPRHSLCIRSWCKFLLARTLTVDRSDWHRLFGRRVARDLITK